MQALRTLSFPRRTGLATLVPQRINTHYSRFFCSQTRVAQGLDTNPSKRQRIRNLSLVVLDKRKKGSTDDGSDVFSDETVGRLGSYPTRFTSIQFPRPFQNVITNLYALAFGCNLDESEKSISQYPSLADFFRRNLKSGARPVDEQAQLVCPVDGRLVQYGILDAQSPRIEQDFMGEDSPVFDVLKRYQSNRKESSGKNLYYCVIYLAPGDYHGYHSPTEWKIQERIHFPVASFAVKFIKGLFAMNERVVLNGEWKHGFFSYSPVGAYNDFDTNLKNQTPHSAPQKVTYNDQVVVGRGEGLGFFNLGSSIVMIWESPPIAFQKERGSKIKLGEPLTVEISE